MGRLKVPEQVVAEYLDNEAVLLNLKTGVYFSLNPSGAHAWKLIGEHGDIDRIRKSMEDAFDATPEQIRKDLETLLKNLREHGLVEEVE